MHAGTLSRNVCACASSIICAHASASILACASLCMCVRAGDSGSIHTRAPESIRACGGRFACMYAIMYNTARDYFSSLSYIRVAQLITINTGKSLSFFQFLVTALTIG